VIRESPCSCSSQISNAKTNTTEKPYFFLKKKEKEKPYLFGTSPIGDNTRNARA